MRTVRGTFIAIAGLAAALAIIVPVVAGAAPAAPALVSLRSAVGVGAQSGRSMLVITGTLPDSVQLPAKIVMGIPSGLAPGWVGEIAGTDPSQDPTATYTIAPGQRYDTITLTLKKVRTGQVEFTLPASAPSGAATYAADVPILGKVDSVILEFRLPTGSTITTSSPGIAPVGSSGGVDYYSVTKNDPKQGTTVRGIVVAGASPAQAGTGAPASGSGATGGGGGSGEAGVILVILVSALAGFLGVFGYFRVREKSSAPAPDSASPPPSAPRPQGTGSKKKRKRPAPHAEPAVEPVEEPEDEPEDAPDDGPRDEPVEEQPEDEAPESEEPVAPEPDLPPAVPDLALGLAPAPGRDGGIIERIKQLAALRTSGLLDEDEFVVAKKELLSGDERLVGLLGDLARFKGAGLLTEAEFSAAKVQLRTGSTEMVVGIEELAALEHDGLLSRDEFRSVVDDVLGT